MPYTTTQLITGAYYASGVVSREFETVSGGQLNDGLHWLNNIITEKRIDDAMIPYETKYAFNAEIGKETYWIPDLVQIDTLVFYLDEVRYSMVYSKRNEYFGAPRVENIKTLPYEWYFERKVGGGNLHIYFFPDKNYPMEVHGTFQIPPVILGQDLASYETYADLGVPTIYGQGTLLPGQLVVTVPIQSGNVAYDLQGNYISIGVLQNYINTGIIPGVSARVDVDDFVLYSDTEPATQFYVQTTGYPPNGTRFLTNLAVATTTNLNAFYTSGSQPLNPGIGATLTSNVAQVLVIDGYTVNLGDAILVKDETAEYYNGVYTLTTLGTTLVPWVLTRATYYDQAVQIQIGDLFTILNGLSNINSSFVQTSQVSYVGDSNIVFVKFSAITFSNFSTIEQPLYNVYNPVGFDEFYLTYLRYALADRICAEYNYTTPENVVRQLSKYESWINKKSRVMDLRLTKVSTLQKRGSFSWAFVNLGKGWIRPG
jgi:hypothetical protein